MIALGALVIAAAIAAGGTDTLRYDLTLARDDSMRPVIDVRVRFRGNAGSRTVVELPHAWAGHSDLERSVTHLSVIQPTSARLVASDSAHRRILTHPPGAPIELRYRLRQDWTGPVRRPQYFRAMIDDDFIIIMGQNALVRPMHQDGVPFVVEFAWHRVPPDWFVAGSFGEGKTQRGRTTMHDFLEGVLVAGRFRSYNASAYGRPMRIMIRGSWSFADSDLVRTASDLATRQRAFWHDSTARYYLIAAVPAVGGTGGTAFTHALVMYADTTSRLSGFATLVSHEMFHEWNGHAIRTAGIEGGMKWLSEGFTEFFADRFARDAGVLSPDQFLGRVNDAIRHYYVSPVRNSGRDDVIRSYWSDPEMNRFPYYQGYLIAGFLDAQLKNAASRRFAIDSLLFALYRRTRTDGRLVDDTMFAAAAPASARDAVRDSIRSFVVEGNTVPVLPGGFADCLEVHTADIYPFDLGFDAPASTRDRVVRGVRSGSPADSAGLVDGMRLRGWSWFNGDANRPALVRIVDGDTIRIISWTPRGPHAKAVPQLSRRADCK